MDAYINCVHFAKMGVIEVQGNAKAPRNASRVVSTEILKYSGSISLY